MDTQITSEVKHEWLQLADFAEKVSKANLLPDHLRGKPADCLLVAMQARRWQMDFFAVAQCTSIVRGKPMYEGKLVAAAINSSKKLSKPLNHRFKGETQPNLSVTIIGHVQGEEEPREWTVQWEEGFKHAQDKNQWLASPKKRLLYFATREWARVHMPEVMLGVVADDEQLPDAEPKEKSVGFMPASAEVKVKQIEQKPQVPVTSTPVKEPVVVDVEPVVDPSSADNLQAEEPDAKFTDLLGVIQDTESGEDLKRWIAEAESLSNPDDVQTAKKAIRKRAKDLGLTWDGQQFVAK